MSQKYIVVFHDHVSRDQIKAHAEEVKNNGGEITNPWHEEENSILNGFAAVIPESFMGNLQGHENIKYVEPDGIVTTQ